MIKLKDLLLENLLLEITSEKTILYHRSQHKFEIGDTIKPYKGGKEHWLAKKNIERELENYRKIHYSNKPSRFNCVYLSVVPSSRFRGKGILYEVKIKSGKKWHLTNSTIIDELGEGEADYYRREALFDQYWNPSKYLLSKSQVKMLEVLAEEIEVVKIIGEPDILKIGDVVELNRDFVVNRQYLYDSKGTIPLSEEEINKFEKNKNIEILKREKKYGSAVTDVKYKKGSRFKVLAVKRADSGKYKKRRKYEILRFKIVIPKIDVGLTFTAGLPKSQWDFLKSIRKIK